MKGNAGKIKSVSRRVWWTRSVVLLSPSSSILLLAVNIFKSIIFIHSNPHVAKPHALQLHKNSLLSVLS